MVRTPKIIAHRGSAILAPENTRNAFDLAISLQADRLEADVRTSSDGVPVIFHDARLNRITNGSGYVSDHTVSKLKTLDAAWHFRDFNNQSLRNKKIEILTLTELLSEYADIPIHLEIKHPNPEFAQTIAAEINKYRQKDNIVVASFHDEVIHSLRKIAPDIPTAATRDETQDLYASRRRLSRWTNYLHEYFFDRHSLSNNKTIAYQTLQIPTEVNFGPFSIDLAEQKFIQHIHRHNLTVGYWTINDAHSMRQLADKGADALVTDRVDIARELFK